MTQQITITAIKGGVGKTTLAFHLAKFLPGRKLLIDLDPQSSLTNLYELNLGLTLTDNPSIVSLFQGEKSLDEIIIPIPEDDIYLIPNNRANFDYSLDFNNLQLLGDINAKLMGAGFDYIICDTSPAESNIIHFAKVTAHKIIIPFTPDVFSLIYLQKSQDQLQYGSNVTIIPNKIKRTTSHTQTLNQIMEIHGKQVAPAIPESESISQSLILNKPAWEINPKVGEQIKESLSYAVKSTRVDQKD